MLLPVKKQVKRKKKLQMMENKIIFPQISFENFAKRLAISIIECYNVNVSSQGSGQGLKS